MSHFLHFKMYLTIFKSKEKSKYLVHDRTLSAVHTQWPNANDNYNTRQTIHIYIDSGICAKFAKNQDTLTHTSVNFLNILAN